MTYSDLLLTVKFSKWVAGGTIQGKVGLASCEVKKNRMSSVCLCRLLVEDADDVEVVTEVVELWSRAGVLSPGVVVGLVWIGFVFSAGSTVMCVPITIVLFEPRDPMSI